MQSGPDDEHLAELDREDDRLRAAEWGLLCGWDRSEDEQIAAIFAGELVPMPPRRRR